MTQLVVFDLDETLVHATEHQLPIEHLTRIEQYFVYERPHVRRLLQFVAARFDVGVWSSSSGDYIQHVLSHLLPEGYPLKFAWSADRCVQRPDVASGGYVYIKDLRKLMRLGYAPEKVVIVDDSPEKVPRQPTSHLIVRPFTGDPGDSELLTVEAELTARAKRSGARSENAP